MKKLVKPEHLKPGDKVATVSLSWGGAGDPDLLWRYRVGKARLEALGLEVVEMDNTLKGSDFVYEHPEKRAEDFMNAFKDKSIKGIFSCIGGSESIRLLPYIDFDVIRDNPKVFIGYSDTTIGHFMCMKAGLSSFYGPSVLAEFAENVEMHDYTLDYFKKAVFETDVIGEIKPSFYWTNQYLEWKEENKNIKREVYNNKGYEILQGNSVVRGNLIGGCIEVIEFMKETPLWPEPEEWNDSILFLETSEDTPFPEYVEYWLRSYGIMGIFNRIKGIVFGKPYKNEYYNEYKEVIERVIRNEFGKKDLPVVYNVNVGHADPKCTLPYGALAEIDCNKGKFSVLESGTL